MSTLFLIILGVALASVALIGVAYNGLVRRRNRVDSTWSDVDVLLRRRHDLVPNLVATVSGYASHEQAALRGVTEARATAVAAQGPVARGEAESTLGTKVSTVFAMAEVYPSLKASTSFVQLQQQLATTEDAHPVRGASIPGPDSSFWRRSARGNSKQSQRITNGIGSADRSGSRSPPPDRAFGVPTIMWTVTTVAGRGSCQSSCPRAPTCVSNGRGTRCVQT